MASYGAHQVLRGPCQRTRLGNVEPPAPLHRNGRAKRKRTMEAADLLYGVTMQPGGSSQILAEKAGAQA